VYDLAGNVSEWVADYFDPTYFQESPVYNPQGPPGGTARTIRGGAWNWTGFSTRLTARLPMAPTERLPGVGFRCARTLRRDAPATAPPALRTAGVGCTRDVKLAETALPRPGR
jgi:iron(II)-dependent oxidoreductase